MFKRALSSIICFIMLISTFVGTGVFASASNTIADEILAQAQAEPIEEPTEEPTVSAPEIPTATADKNSSVVVPDTATATYSGTCGANLTWSLNTTTGVLNITGTGDMYEYAYEYYNGESITSAPWGEYWSYIKSVVISDSVTSIGDSAFWGCNLITSVTIGNSVLSIGNSAFYHCYSITSVNIVDLTSWCNIYFDDYSANPLNYANKLYLNSELITDLIIPATVTKISDYAFYYCTSLKTVIIPDSVISIGYKAFNVCTALVSIDLGNSVTSITDFAFNDCDALTSITIPDTVTTIGAQAFSSCDTLTDVTIPNSVTSIGSYAFYCSPVTIKCNENSYAHTYAVNNGISYELLNVVSGTCGDDLTWSLNTTTGVLTIDGTGEMYSYGNEPYNNYSYRTAAPWKDYISEIKSVVIGDHVTNIPGSAFYGCWCIENIRIGNAVESIGYRAFHSCSKLKSVTIPESVKRINQGAFRNSGLTSLTIYGSDISFGLYAFYNCDNFAGVYISDIAKWCTMTFDDMYSNPLYVARNLYVDNELKRVITIPDTVEAINEYAFSGSSLKRVTIAHGVKTIGSCAFQSCTDLVEVNISDTVSVIGSDSFRYCKKLSSVSIGNSVASIGADAFSDTAYYSDNSNWVNDVLYIDNCLIVANTSIRGSYSINDGTVCIADSAFNYCNSLTDVMIPDSVVNIGNNAFYKSTSLSSVTVDANNEYYYSDEFGVLYNKEKSVLIKYPVGNERTTFIIPSSVTSINKNAFDSCTTLTSVTIPDSVTSIENYAFYNCTALTCVTIPDSVTSIENYAFYNCTALTCVTIGGCVASIGDYAFYYYDELNYDRNPINATFICYEGSYVHTYLVENGFNYEFIEIVSGTCGDYLEWNLDTFSGVLTVDGIGDMYDYSSEYSSGPYKTTAPWSEHASSITTVIIGDSVTGIGNNAFAYCSAVKSVIIGDSVMSVGDEAFYDCDSLAEVTLGHSITELGRSAFGSCWSIKNVYVTDIAMLCHMVGHDNYSNPLCYGTNLYLNGELVTDLVIPDSVTIIRDYAFSGCDSIISITIPDTVTTISSNAFARCSSLVSIDMGNSVKGIGIYAFECCSNLESVIIPDSVTYIGGSAFWGCGSLESVVIGDSVKGIYEDTFYSCLSLKNVTIGDSVEFIIDRAFGACKSLTEVTIPASVKNMSSYAFCDCYSLVAINVDSENQYYISFEGVVYTKDITSLVHYPVGNQRTSFVVPDSVITIADYSIYDCKYLTSITIPNSVTSIGDGVFYNCPVTIKCHENSYAHTYAVENGFKYELICDHSFTSYISNGNATCTEDGTKTAYCDNGCGTTDTVVVKGTALGHSWSEWIVTVEPTYTAEGKQIRFCYVCNEGETESIPMLANPNKPVISVDNFKVTITNADLIKDMRYAPGEYTTTTEIRNAEGNVAISEALVVKNTLDGSFVYEMPNAGYFTIWIRMKDGTNYIMPLDVTKVTPSISTYGVKITLHNLYNVKDFYIAKGEYQTYREIKDNGYIVSITGVKIGTKHDYTYTVYEPGVHTILVRYNDGTQALFHETLVVDEPVFTTNGLQVTVSNLPDVKVIRTAYGEWNTVKELKATDTLRNFSAKTAIKGKDPYTIQYREDGMVTIIVEYNNGYQKVFHYNVQHKKSNCTVTGDTVLLRDLDGLVMVRYAMGEYATSAEIKRAPGSKYLKPADLTNGYAIVSGLTKGTYTFCVQFDDESYNYFTVTIK